MSTTHQPRTPAGSPDGGQYASRPGGNEADTAILDNTDDQWGRFTGADTVQERATIATELTSPELLTELTGHWSFLVRRAVADNPHTPVDSLDTLSRDRDPHVRRHARAALRNPHPTPVDSSTADALRRTNQEIAKLKNSRDVWEQKVTTQNMNEPAALNHAAQSWSYLVREEAARNSATPLTTLTALADDEHPKVRIAALRTHRLPLSVYANLTHDPVAAVRKVARARSGIQSAIARARTDAEHADIPLDDATVELALAHGDSVQLKNLASSGATPRWALEELKKSRGYAGFVSSTARDTIKAHSSN